MMLRTGDRRYLRLFRKDIVVFFIVRDARK